GKISVPLAAGRARRAGKTVSIHTMGKTSAIHIDVSLDEQKVPEEIRWNATDSASERDKKAKAMILSLWEGAEKSAMRIDLWTKTMMVDEMAEFYYQTLLTMADTYERATQYRDQAEAIKQFAKDFLKTFQEKQRAAQGGSPT